MATHQYKKVQIKLKSFGDDISYPPETNFRQTHLVELIHTFIANCFFWINGNGEATLNTKIIPHNCSTTILYWRKPSLFMPNNNNAWAKTAQIGNPTQSPSLPISLSI